MGRNFGSLVCLMIIIVDVVAGILGIQAEVAQNTTHRRDLKAWALECRDPSYEAYKLGMAAAVLLAFAHVFANLLGGCFCIWSKADYEKATANKQLAVASLVLSWMALAAGFSMLIIGTLANSKSRRSCGISNLRLLSIGGIMCFVHGLFTVAYYVSAAATAREEQKIGQGEPARASGTA